MDQRQFTRKIYPIPDRYWAIRQRACLEALKPLLWVKAARIARDRCKPAAADPGPNRYGLVFRGKFRTWGWLKKNTVCRLCHKPIGQPVVDPKTGIIDHEGISCYGPHEHVILAEGDLMLSGQFEWQKIKQQLEAEEILKIYAPPARTGLGQTLYPAPIAGLD